MIYVPGEAICALIVVDEFQLRVGGGRANHGYFGTRRQHEPNNRVITPADRYAMPSVNPEVESLDWTICFTALRRGHGRIQLQHKRGDEAQGDTIT
eukprot:s268_g6.t1